MPNPTPFARAGLVSAILVLSAVAGFAATAHGSVPTAARMELNPSSFVRVDGNSTLHRYHLVTHELEVRMSVEPAARGPSLEDAIRLGKATQLEVDIPVAALKSGEGGLDDNVRKALHSEAHPSITFVMGSYLAKTSTPAGGGLQLEVRGVLSVNGVERPVVLELTIVSTPTGLKVTGSQALSMKDFQVEPPVLMFGTLKTADAVTITWDFLLETQAG
jgi:hypothetical protein